MVIQIKIKIDFKFDIFQIRKKSQIRKKKSQIRKKNKLRINKLMIYKNLNKNIQDKIDQNVRIKHKKIFKESLLMDLLAYHIKNNMDFVKNLFIY